MTDCNGRTPKLGDFVAYNQSGSIATGWITHVGKNRWNPTYTITQHAPKRREGNKSRVEGGPSCTLVLEEY